MNRAKPTNGKKASKLVSVKYCDVCRSSHTGPVNHGCLVAGTKKVTAYVLAQNLSPEVFDNSSSDSVSDVVPPTPRLSDDTDIPLTASRDATPSGATPSTSEADSHVRNLFNPQHVTSPAANANANNNMSFDIPPSGSTQRDMPPPSHLISPSASVSASTTPPSDVQLITPQSAPPAGAIITDLKGQRVQHTSKSTQVHLLGTDQCGRITRGLGTAALSLKGRSSRRLLLRS